MAEANESRVPMSRAELRRTEGLAASLRRDRDAVLRWKDDNPLRLVAAALVDVPSRDMKLGRASKKSIGERVVPDIMESSREWENWWKKVQPGLSDSPHFDYDPKDARKGIRRKSKPSEIDPVSLSALAPPAPKSNGVKVTWLEWFVSDDDIPMPKSPLRMNKKLAGELWEQDAALVPTIISNLRVEIEKRAFGANKSRKTSSGAWVKVFSAVLARWSELPATPDVSTAEVVSLTARLKGVSELNQGDWESLVESLANYTSANVRNSQEIANAIIASSRTAPGETTALLEQIHGLLGELVRKDLWRRLITSDSGQISGWLNNRWRKMPSDSEKEEIVSSLIMSARDSDSVGDLDSLLSDMWNMAESNLRAHLFNPILMGWILHREMMPKVERVLQKLAEEIGTDDGQDPESAADSPHENPIMRRWREIVKAASQNKIGRLRAEHQREIAEKDRLLSVAESEIERVDKGKVYFQEKLRGAASATSLIFNRDAIVMLGEWFRDMSASPLASHTETRGIQEKIKIALSALGAEPFGQIGEHVPFDLISHETNPPPSQGSLVKIIAPGVAHVRDEHTPRTMVKARVNVEERA